MSRTLTAAALVGVIALASVPALTSAAFAQAPGPEPMQGAQPMDNPGAGGGMEKESSGSMKKHSMKKHSSKMKHHKKSM